MSPILLYLLKANAALLLFAAAYFGLLRRLTFFTLNRFYLLFALVFSAAYPVLPMPAMFPAAAAFPGAFVLTEAPVVMGAAATAGPVALALDWGAVGLVLYAGGAAVLLGRLLVQLLSLWQLRRTSRPSTVHGQPIRALAGAVSPFSFWQTVYLNPLRHPDAELDAVLRHEQVHVRQWHTLDVLLAHLVLAGAWCNPAAWLLRRALLDNLEYLADHAALQTGLDRRAYQYSLLRLSQGAAGPSLVSHFTFPTLKNRVAMMNTPLSSTGQLARYFVAGPLVLAVALGFSAAQAQGAGLVVPAAQPAKAVPVGVPTPRQAARAVAPQKAAVPSPSTSAAVSLSPTVKSAAPKKAVGRPTAPATTQQAAAATVNTAPAAAAEAQQSSPPIYYVDGQVYTGDINTLKPNDILSMHVLKGDRARQAFGEAAAAGIIIITTKQNQNQPAVLAFNEKLGLGASAYISPLADVVAKPGRVAYLAPDALAYITKAYPGARLLGVSEVPGVDGGAARYQAEIVLGRRPGYLLFDAQGKFISDSYTSHAH